MSSHQVLRTVELAAVILLLTLVWRIVSAKQIPDARCNISYYAVSKGEEAGGLVLSRVDTAGELDSGYLLDWDGPLTVLLHGLGGFFNHSFNQQTAKALLALGKKNILVVDYGGLVPGRDYPRAVQATEQIGLELGRFLSDVTVPLELVGFSLGAHVAGVAGHALSTTYNQTVARIIGLDPAHPLIGDLDKALRLDETDADFVMVVHTAGGAMGGLEPIGDVDFYPNGGLEPQPHCRMPGDQGPANWGVNSLVEVICSHTAAYEYMADSVNGGYTATRCGTWEDYLAGGCAGQLTLPMGFKVPSSARGRYFLRTRSEDPLGEAEEYPDPGPYQLRPPPLPAASSDSERRELDAWGLLTGLAILGGQVCAVYLIYQYTPY